MMKDDRKHEKPFCLDDSGFSLVEILISVVVLVIIMVPLMSNFFESMTINNKADEIQESNNLAASVMEGMKTLNMEETLEQFHGSLGDFDVVTAPDGSPSVRDLKQLKKLPDGTFEVAATPFVSSDTYYFALNQIEYDGKFYDSVIELNPLSYRSIPDTMNDFAMPDIMNLDMNVNEKLFTKIDTNVSTGATLDSDALDTYLQWGRAYALRLWEQSTEYQNYLEDHDRWRDECARLSEPPYPAEPTPPVFNEDDPRYNIFVKKEIVETYITKTMIITINGYTIDFKIEYNCNWQGNPSGLEGKISHQILGRTKTVPIDNIALFYTPSRYQLFNADKILIENLNPTGNPIDLYIAKQNGGEVLGKGIEIHRSSESDDISIFIKLDQFEDPSIIDHILVNMIIGGINKGTTGINPELIRATEEDRIYDLTVSIYEFIDSGNPNDKYKNLICSLKSTRED